MSMFSFGLSDEEKDAQAEAIGEWSSYEMSKERRATCWALDEMAKTMPEKEAQRLLELSRIIQSGKLQSMHKLYEIRRDLGHSQENPLP